MPTVQEFISLFRTELPKCPESFRDLLLKIKLLTIGAPEHAAENFMVSAKEFLKMKVPAKEKYYLIHLVSAMLRTKDSQILVMFSRKLMKRLRKIVLHINQSPGSLRKENCLDMYYKDASEENKIFSARFYILLLESWKHWDSEVGGIVPKIGQEAEKVAMFFPISDTYFHEMEKVKPRSGLLPSQEEPLDFEGKFDLSNSGSKVPKNYFKKQMSPASPSPNFADGISSAVGRLISKCEQRILDSESFDQLKKYVQRNLTDIGLFCKDFELDETSRRSLIKIADLCKEIDLGSVSLEEAKRRVQELNEIGLAYEGSEETDRSDPALQISVTSPSGNNSKPSLANFFSRKSNSDNVKIDFSRSNLGTPSNISSLSRRQDNLELIVEQSKEESRRQSELNQLSRFSQFYPADGLQFDDFTSIHDRADLPDDSRINPLSKKGVENFFIIGSNHTIDAQNLPNVPFSITNSQPPQSPYKNVRTETKKHPMTSSGTFTEAKAKPSRPANVYSVFQKAAPPSKMKQLSDQQSFSQTDDQRLDILLPPSDQLSRQSEGSDSSKVGMTPRPFENSTANIETKGSNAPSFSVYGQRNTPISSSFSRSLETNPNFDMNRIKSNEGLKSSPGIHENVYSVYNQPTISSGIREEAASLNQLQFREPAYAKESPLTSQLPLSFRNDLSNPDPNSSKRGIDTFGEDSIQPNLSNAPAPFSFMDPIKPLVSPVLVRIEPDLTAHPPLSSKNESFESEKSRKSIKLSPIKATFEPPQADSAEAFTLKQLSYQPTSIKNIPSQSDIYVTQRHIKSIQETSFDERPENVASTINEFLPEPSVPKPVSESSPDRASRAATPVSKPPGFSSTKSFFNGLFGPNTHEQFDPVIFDLQMEQKRLNETLKLLQLKILEASEENEAVKILKNKSIIEDPTLKTTIIENDFYEKSNKFLSESNFKTKTELEKNKSEVNLKFGEELESYRKAILQLRKQLAVEKSKRNSFTVAKKDLERVAASSKKEIEEMTKMCSNLKSKLDFYQKPPNARSIIIDEAPNVIVSESVTFANNLINESKVVQNSEILPKGIATPSRISEISPPKKPKKEKNFRKIMKEATKSLSLSPDEVLALKAAGIFDTCALYDGKWAKIELSLDKNQKGEKTSFTLTFSPKLKSSTLAVDILSESPIESHPRFPFRVKFEKPQTQSISISNSALFQKNPSIIAFRIESGKKSFNKFCILPLFCSKLAKVSPGIRLKNVSEEKIGTFKLDPSVLSSHEDLPSLFEGVQEGSKASTYRLPISLRSRSDFFVVLKFSDDQTFDLSLQSDMIKRESVEYCEWLVWTLCN